MANLTIEEKVVYEAAELNPIEGYALAIFEAVGEGHEFREIITPGNRFRKRFGKKYLAIAVNTAPNLTLEFSARIGNRGTVHSFNLDFSINYSVIDPKSIAVQMKNDPLRQLREEIKDTIGRTFWNTLQHQIEQDSKHNAVLTLAAEASTDVSDTTDLQKIRTFAANLGIAVKSIEVDYKTDEAGLETDNTTQNADLEMTALEVERGKTLHAELTQEEEDRIKMSLKASYKRNRLRTDGNRLYPFLVDPDQITPRYSDVSFPSHTRIGQTEALRVAITIKRVNELAIVLALDPPSNTGESMKVDVLPVVSPVDFELDGPTIQTIEVPLATDSIPVIFKLTPKHEGRKPIAVEFFQEARYLGRAELETTVSREAQPSRIESAQARLSLGSQEPPDLTILFDRVALGNGRHYYRYKLLSHLRELDLYFEEFHTPETAVDPEETLGEIIEQLNQGANPQRLHSIGVGLYNDLFPDGLKRLYWEKLRGHVKSLLIISDEPWVPWELIRPCHPQNHSEDPFLCEKFNLARWLAGAAPPDTIKLDRMALIMTTASLDAASAEADAIQKLFGDAVEQIEPSADEVYRLLKTGGFSGIHFACHGEYNPKDPNSSELYLENGETLQPRDINGEKLSFGEDRPLVFVNACTTGRGGYALTGLGGWAEAFVRRATGSGFIGSIWDADDDAAYKFAAAFYRHLFGNGLNASKTVAEAARLARAAIRTPTDPTWLSYTIYANPQARLEANTSKNRKKIVFVAADKS